MARPKIRLNHRGVEEILKSSGVRAALHEEAEPVLAEAQRLANRHRDTGAYASAFSIRDDTTDRAVVRVVNSDPKAMLLEAMFGILSKSATGKRRAAARERARQRRLDRKYNESIRREEDAAER